MPELHSCTCEYSESAPNPVDGSPVVVDGCSAVPYRDVCRFEQALADPVQAQVDAVAAVLERQFSGPPEAAYTMADVAREALAAAAAVVLERPPCTRCGRPLGTGTLLDFAPEMPKGDPALGGYAVSVPTLAPNDWFVLPSPDAWPEFAARYRCPACADSERSNEAAVDGG